MKIFFNNGCSSCLCIVLLTCVSIARSDGRQSVGQRSTATALQTNLAANLLEYLEVLYVMDPNSDICFERVYIDDFAAANLLPWVRGLKDELTRTPNNSQGEELKVL